MLKKFAAEYFIFTKKERVGILVILTLILVFTLLPFLFPYFITEKKYDHTAFEKEIAALKIKQTDSSQKFQKKDFDKENSPSYNRASEKNYYEAPVKASLFYFDPNTLSGEGWKKLGIREKTITTIQNYISKGGKFYKPEDISKIWGLHKDEVQRLLPFVSILQKTIPVYSEKKIFDNKSKTKIIYKIIPVDINTADTTAFIALPGIGSKLANRIINFRDKLGGFYKVEQVAETFALPDSTFQKIKANLILTRAMVKKININTATLDEMKIHPYIRYNLASAVVQYRLQHGVFLTISDIKKIMMVTEDIYLKLAPYLSVQ